MRYVLIDSKNGDLFTKEFDSEDVAVDYCKREWESLSDHDKSLRDEFCVIQSDDPNEDSESHLDGAVIISLK